MKKVLLPLIGGLKNENCIIVVNFLVEGRKLLDGIRKESMCYTLFPKKPNLVITKENPKEIIELLTKFKDIILDNVLDGLPLVSSIFQCMDLVQRASLLNMKLIKIQ